MIALLLAMLPQPSYLDGMPTVESIEANYVSRPVYEPDCWWCSGWERSLSQIIIRDVHAETGCVEVLAWSGGGQERIRVNYADGWYWVQTTAGVVKSRVFFESYTDYDPEREEAYERLPVERRRGWPK